MKQLFIFIFALISYSIFGQQINPNEWDIQGNTNKVLLPKYGNLPKTDEEKNADNELVKTILDNGFTLKQGSDHAIEVGFTYLYKGDLKTAMSRFNQAYLLDSTNTDIYWGFGAVYIALGKYILAKKQYLEGLAQNPTSPHLLTDYGTCLMMQSNELSQKDQQSAQLMLDSAIFYLNKSYSFDSKDQITTFKLSICYCVKDDCNNAWKYYDECKSLGGKPITEDYTNDLKNRCARSK